MTIAARWTDRPPAGWNELSRLDRNATPGHRPELWSALAATRPGMRAAFVAIEERETLIGGAAVLIEARAGVRWIHGLPHLLPGAPLAHSGRHDEVDLAVAEALAGLQLVERAAGGEWVLYRPEGPAIARASLERLDGETRMVAASVLDLGAGMDSIWGRLDRKARADLRHVREVGLRFSEDPGSLDQAWSLHATQARAWRGHRPSPLELARRLLAPSGSAEPLARLFTLHDRAGIVSSVLCLDHPREILAWWSGTRPIASRPRSVFAFLLWSVAEWGAARGRARLNLGASAGREGLAEFKDALGAGAVRYPVRWLSATHATGFGKLIASVQSRMRRDRHRGAAE